MTTINTTSFSGIVPKVDPLLLPNQNAQAAMNCDIRHGDLRPLMSPELAWSNAAYGNGLWVAETNDSFYSFSRHVNVVKHPTNGVERLYWSDGVAPKFTTAMHGNSGEPSPSYLLGVPAPTSAPTVEVINRSVPWDIEVWGNFEDPVTGNNIYNVKLTYPTHFVEIPGTNARSFLFPLAKKSEVPAGTIPVVYMVFKDKITGKEVGRAYSSNSMWSKQSRTQALNSSTAQANYTVVTSPDFPEYSSLSTAELQNIVLNSQALLATNVDGFLGPMLAADTQHRMSEAQKIIDARAAGGSQLAGGVIINNTTTPAENTVDLGFDITINFYDLDGLTMRADSYIGTVTSRAYTFTYVNQFGEESAPSPASAVLNLDSMQDVKLTFPVPPSGYAVINNARLYRSNTGTSGTEYQLVAASNQPLLSWVATYYLDNVPDSGLMEVLPSMDWDLPPQGLQGLCLLPCGSLAGFVGSDIYFSEPYRPFAWPRKYKQNVGIQVQAIVSHGNSVIAMTNAYPYMISGSHPNNMTPMRLPATQRLIHSSFYADLGERVVYASDDGVVSVSGSGVSLQETGALWAKDNWKAFSSGRYGAFKCAAAYDNKLYAFFATGGFIMDLTSLSLVEHNIQATAAYYHALSDTLYIVNAGNVSRVEKGAAQSFTWKSKRFRLPRPTNFGAAQILIDSGSVTFNVYYDGVLEYTRAVTSSEPFRLPGGIKSRDFEFELVGSGKVTQVILAETMLELQNA